jgi:hypothetical protein
MHGPSHPSDESLVHPHNGENQIKARGASQDEAWHNALAANSDIGMTGSMDRAKRAIESGPFLAFAGFS